MWAVGYTSEAIGTGTLALHWDGARWWVVPSPKPGTGRAFAGISALPQPAEKVRWVFGSSEQNVVFPIRLPDDLFYREDGQLLINVDLAVRPLTRVLTWYAGNAFLGGISRQPEAQGRMIPWLFAVIGLVEGMYFVTFGLGFVLLSQVK